MSVSVLAAACGSAAPQTFHPGGGGSAGTATTPAPASATSAAATTGSFTRPPFGANAHVEMTSWHPASASEAAAVRTAKTFLLAVLYADYTGGRDHRWTSYVSSDRVRSGLAATLAAPSVTTESFTGTVRFWRMHASATSGAKGTVAVTECVDSTHARNTDLKTGKVLPGSLQNPADQNYYSNTDVLALGSGGQWRVVSIPATIYYPQAQECKP